MSYIGNPIVSTDFPVDYKSGNGSTTAFTLSVAPASVNSIDVQISGVSQSPQTYSVSGTTLTFSAAPPSGTNNIVVRHLGVAGIPNTPSAGSVVPASIGTGYSLWNLSGSDINYTAGNVGIGTSSPTARLHVSSPDGTAPLTLNSAGGSDSTRALNFNVAGDNYGKILVPSGSGGAMAFWTGGANSATERMRIDSSGNLLVATTSNFSGAGGKLAISTDTGAYSGVSIKDTGTTYGANYQYITFVNAAGSNIAAIQHNASTTVNYATSSDARLKKDLGIATSTEVIDNIVIHNFEWKEDGRIDRGVFAQEANEIKPSAISIGTDELTESGELLKPWGVDYSKFVPDLIVYCQQLKKSLDELNAKVEAQATEIKALKGAA